MSGEVEGRSIESWMQQAIDLAEKGRGFVEPNPMVGCLLLKNNQVIGRGYHRQFGGPHAEINALESCSESPQGATAIVSLEPCCHHGKTPPCSTALIDAGIRRVIIGLQDPNPAVDGGGILQLKNAGGIDVQAGFLSEAVAIQNAGFLKRIKTGQPWVIAKYAMTLDGNIATETNDSRWISNEKSREKVHLLRSRIDAILVGSKTAAYDNPRLTARPSEPDQAGPRTPLRIALDSQASLSTDSSLVQSAREIPTMLVVHPAKADKKKCDQLASLGVEIFELTASYGNRIGQLLDELGKREMTNLMVEGGAGVLGEFYQQDAIDEVQVFLAPKLVGLGKQPFEIPSINSMDDAREFRLLNVEKLDNNVFIRSMLNTDILKTG